MFCINCFHPTTRVVNSRPNKKASIVWRRRYCTKCNISFTTHERPSLADNQAVQLPDGVQAVFNLGKLIQSIAAAFSHSPLAAQYDSLPLAQTTEAILSTSDKALSPDLIAATTYRVLQRFDPLAAVQYGAKHHIVTAVRRPGRPSLSSSDALSQS